MMKDMKWKNIDTVYAGKALQAEAEEINLHGEVNITGSLSVNGGSISTPTAADVSYDNTASGLTADDVQDAIDEINSSMGKIYTTTVTAYSFSSQSGSIYIGSDIAIDVDDDYTSGKVFIGYDAGATCWPVMKSITNNKVTVAFCRQQTGSVNLTVHILCFK